MNNVEVLKKRVDELGLKSVKYSTHKAVFSVEQGIKEVGIDFGQGASTLIFKTSKGYIGVHRRDDRKIISGKLKKFLGENSISLASPDEVKKEFGYTVGAVGLYHPRLKYIMDKSLLEKDIVYGGAGDEFTDLSISPLDLQKLCGDTVADFTEQSNRVSVNKKRILTGDRPTGGLHIGHLIGSLQNRVKLQDEYEQYIIIANVQALSDNFDNPELVKESMLELLCDYYAVGIDFEKTTIFIQSEVPQIHEMFVYLANFATVQQIQHNPTIKTELAQHGMEKSTPLGFFMYPIHQAADILCVNADLVPVGKDNAPMVEDCREIAKKFNATYGKKVFHEPKELLGIDRNLPGIDGNAKMSKSLHNCIYLSDSEEELRKKVFKIYTDPERIRVTDKGHIEGNVAFIYHDAFNPNKEEVEDLKAKYVEGKVSDVEVKEKLFVAMNTLLTPIREKRKETESMKSELFEKAMKGSEKVRVIASGIVKEMKKAMMIDF
ncbi:tryptophan--tRNA ligase [Candidatus Dojkabacteria bacterium]|jgi:tryptophanyl-tRNA synthetase|nr:tryptophan--tRNA ligase [Candidatus Dojkabacteria bacterium]